MVYYYSGGLRLNPNLYECGKVCLSLLNTWTGKGNEKWMPKKSTMLQVLVSIQALILNAKPFFNEPGYDDRYPGAEGERKSKAYNEEMFILSLKTMMYTLRRPPKVSSTILSVSVIEMFSFCYTENLVLRGCRNAMEWNIIGYC
jgi:ubiquitin-conjugating enzyme E2 O